ncbi:hypothetical protein VNO77_46238 [Canavalia gladiata]|uniref:Uncharacterized protein n=1 Tax=Canavalia gladiata TaxID=3824 RepID=A0AAN9PFV0_CANGL
MLLLSSSMPMPPGMEEMDFFLKVAFLSFYGIVDTVNVEFTSFVRDTMIKDIRQNGPQSYYKNYGTILIKMAVSNDRRIYELSNCQPPPSSMREDSTPARYGLALGSSSRMRCEGGNILSKKLLLL